MKQVQIHLAQINIKMTMNVYTSVTKKGKDDLIDIFDDYMKNEKNPSQTLAHYKNPHSIRVGALCYIAL